MIGKTQLTPVAGCAPLGGWWTDFLNWTKDTAGTAADIYGKYTGAQAAAELQKAQAAAAASQAATISTIAKYGAILGGALLAYSLLTKKR